jgi:hypothetical protein
VSSPNQLIHIETDTTQVRNLIESTARILMDNGATINPSVAIRESAGHLSVHSTAGSVGEPLFVIPQELLLPVTDITWGTTTNANTDTSTGMRSITIESAENLTSVQRELLDLQIALYNSLNKFEWFLNEHPRATLCDFPDIENLFSECEPNFTRGQHPEDFIATRVFGYHDKSPTEDRPPKKSVLMPLLDFMNHDQRGAAYNTNNGELSVLANQPAGDSECLVNYGGLRDALQMFSNYGFADKSSSVATSTPATLPIIGQSLETLGTLVVERKNSKGHLPRITAEDTTLTLSKVTFAPRKLDRFSAAFILPVKSFAMQQGASTELADQIAERVARDLIELNQQRLGALLASVIALNSEWVVLRELESALQFQLRTLDNFAKRLTTP